MPGANGGILSTASLMLGVATSHPTQANVVVAGAGVAVGALRVGFRGALSMVVTSGAGALFGTSV